MVQGEKVIQAQIQCATNGNRVIVVDVSAQCIECYSLRASGPYLIHSCCLTIKLLPGLTIRKKQLISVWVEDWLANSAVSKNGHECPCLDRPAF